MPIRAVFFDVGETLVSEHRLYADYARRLSVSPEQFMATLEEVMADGQPIRTVFERLKPGFDVKQARAQREAEGNAFRIGPADLYPDAAECLLALETRGYFLGIAGNQPASAEATLREAGLAAHCIHTSAGWGVEKPAKEFFAKVIEAAGCAPELIAYVGDRVDNDVLPALASGLRPVLVRRGPWGRAQAAWPAADQAHLRIDSLAELPEALLRL